MKQTNNAIKFLMAQYRAIFKNAYFKGMATALVLTAGLAAGAAQAKDGNYWQFDPNASAPNWSEVEKTPTDNVDSKYTIVAGALAGDAAKLPTTGIDKNTASGGDLIISNDSISHRDIKTMSGSAAGGWAETTASDAHATSNKVTVNLGGKVTLSSESGELRKGEIYGGRAQSNTGRAFATGNVVTIAKGTNADTFAAETGIFGGTAKAGAGATAAGNQVIVNKGNDTTPQKINAVANSKTGANTSRIVGGWVEASSATDTSGVFIARDNSVELYNVTYAGSGNLWKGGFIGGGYVKLGTQGNKANSLSATGNSVSLTNADINNSGNSNPFSIYGEHVTTNTGDSIATADSVENVSVAGDGSKVNLSITNSTLNNVQVYGGLATNKGSTNASGLVVNLDATDLIGEQTAWGGHANSMWVDVNTNTDAIANNNTVNITNSANAENVKTVNSQIFGGIASISSDTASSDFSKVTYYIAGAHAAQYSGSGSTVTLSNNSLTFNATANGPADSSGSIVGALVTTDTASDTATKISVLNNTVTIGANAEVTNMNIVAAKLASGSATQRKHCHCSGLLQRQRGW